MKLLVLKLGLRVERKNVKNIRSGLVIYCLRRGQYFFTFILSQFQEIFFFFLEINDTPLFSMAVSHKTIGLYGLYDDAHFLC